MLLVHFDATDYHYQLNKPVDYKTARRNLVQITGLVAPKAAQFLSLHGTAETMNQLRSLIPTCGTPYLHTFDLTLYLEDPENDDDYDENPHYSTEPYQLELLPEFEQSTASVRCLSLNAMCIRWASPIYHNITSLTISNLLASHMQGFYTMLSHARCLESLSMGNLPNTQADLSRSDHPTLLHVAIPYTTPARLAHFLHCVSFPITAYTRFGVQRYEPDVALQRSVERYRRGSLAIHRPGFAYHLSHRTIMDFEADIIESNLLELSELDAACVLTPPRSAWAGILPEPRLSVSMSGKITPAALSRFYGMVLFAGVTSIALDVGEEWQRHNYDGSLWRDILSRIPELRELCISDSLLAISHRGHGLAAAPNLTSLILHRVSFGRPEDDGNFQDLLWFVGSRQQPLQMLRLVGCRCEESSEAFVARLKAHNAAEVVEWMEFST